MKNPTRTSLGTRISDAADDALEATTHALDSSRQFAAEAAGRVGETARDLRDTALGLARVSAEALSDSTEAAQRQLGKYAGAGRRYVARRPLQSAVIAAAVGVAAAALFMAWKRAHDQQHARGGQPKAR